MKQEESRPWYREFWAWFILAPLILSVVVSSVLVTTAVKFGDDEITDDYYKKGRLINQSMELAVAAKQLGISAVIEFDLELGDITLQLESQAVGDRPEQLLLFLDHAFVEQLDQQLLLKQFAPGRYRADLSHRPEGRWYLRLIPEQAATNWRLNGEIDFGNQSAANLQAL